MLLAVVVGSGIMGERLSAGNIAIALLANAIATALGLFVLIETLGPVSGAHFNPAVTATAVRQGILSKGLGLAYVGVQVVGGIAGTFLAHAMFDLPLLQVSTHAREGVGQFLSEVVAAFGLLFTILALAKARPASIAAAVGAYIGAAYWFTASTSFANPAVTIARALTDTFSGIRPRDALLFIPAQLIGAFAALVVYRLLWPAANASTQREGALR
jgi:glycerol uptake facilitator-like aquaporin